MPQQEKVESELGALYGPDRGAVVVGKIKNYRGGSNATDSVARGDQYSFVRKLIAEFDAMWSSPSR